MEKKRQILLGIGTVLLICGLILSCYWLAKIWEGRRTSGNTVSSDREKEPFLQREKGYGSVTIGDEVYTYYHDISTYLFIGTDASGNEDGTGEEYCGAMADFLLLAILDKTEKNYSFLQLNRDTMTEVTLMGKDGTGMASANLQLCTAHWYGGTKEESCMNTVEAVSRLLGGVRIQGYYSLNMEAIPDLNHAVDGVQVTVTEDFTDVDPEMEKGKTMVLNDRQAYYFVHDRYGIGDEENISRMERQRQYMAHFFGRIQEKSSGNPNFPVNLYEDLSEEATTNITGKMVSHMMNHVSKSKNLGVYTIDGVKKLGKALGDGISHVEFYLDETSRKNTLMKLYCLERE